MMQYNTCLLHNCIFFHLFQPVLLLRHDALKLGKVSQLQKFFTRMSQIKLRNRC